MLKGLDDIPSDHICCGPGPWHTQPLFQTLAKWFPGSPATASLLIHEDVSFPTETVGTSQVPYILVCTRPAEAMALDPGTSAVYKAAKTVWCMEVSQWLHLRRAYGVPEDCLCLVPWLFLC